MIYLHVEVLVYRYRYLFITFAINIDKDLYVKVEHQIPTEKNTTRHPTPPTETTSFFHKLAKLKQASKQQAKATTRV